MSRLQYLVLTNNYDSFLSSQRNKNLKFSVGESENCGGGGNFWMRNREHELYEHEIRT